jgi:hypothetical protein
MTDSSLMHGWVALLGSLAMIALILAALGLILGIVKPADAPKHIGTILGMVVVLTLTPGVLVYVWSGMHLWQQVALVAIGIGVLWVLRPRKKARRSRPQ